MRKQNSQRLRFFGAEGMEEGGVEVGAFDAGDADDFDRGRAGMEGEAFVFDEREIQAGERGAEEIAVVVAENGDHPQAGREGIDQAAGDRELEAGVVLVVDEIAGVDDEVGGVGFHAGDEVVVGVVPVSAGVDVGDVEDSEAFEVVGEAGHGELDVGPFEAFGGEELEVGAEVVGADDRFQFAAGV